MKFFKVVLTITVLFWNLLFSFNCFSQESEPKKKNPNKYEWGNLGLGLPLTQLRSDVTSKSYGADYNRAIGKIFLQGGISGNLRVHDTLPSVFEVHIAPGYAIGYHKAFMIGMSIGPGFMSGDDSHGYLYRGLGANGTLQLLFKPASDIGIGAEVFFNYPFLTNVSKPPASNGIRIILTISTK